jgi:uncharacterized protein (TIGR01777 family)
MKIVIPGGSGQIGHILARWFHANGDEVVVLRRNPSREPWRVVAWDGQNPGAWISELEGSDVCINLAGRSVNCRYHRRNRREIYDSRINTTLLLNDVIASLRQPPPVWLNASTATIYRHALDRAMDEEAGELGGNEPGAPDTWNFSIDVAKGWEQAFFSKDIAGVRKVAMRSAITMSPDRGCAFDVLLGLVRAGLGGAQGPGSQFVSWIHEFDFARAVEFIISRPEFSGVVNIAAPNPLPNRHFMRILRQAWGASFGIPLSEWMIEVGAFFRRTESELVIKSRRVIPGRLQAAGFRFKYAEWPVAARELIARWRSHSGVCSR